VEETEEEDTNATPTTPTTETPSGKTPGTGKQGNGVLNKGDEVVFETGEYYHTSNGDGPTGYHHRGETVKADRYVPGAKKPWHISTLSGGALGWLTKK
jgi:hypothetical protein